MKTIAFVFYFEEYFGNNIKLLLSHFQSFMFDVAGTFSLECIIKVAVYSTSIETLNALLTSKKFLIS